MKNLVMKTIALAKLNSNKTKFSFEEIDLYKELNKNIIKNTYLFKENNIKIINNLRKNIKVKIDKLRIEELFDNIFNNSVKYSGDSGKIILDAVENDHFITILIKDDGIGMNKEHINHIFDEFYKADESRHDFDSSGLGMPICKRIVEKHGGKIWVESKGINKGTTVSFTLPLV
jgi:signal transduction histidine kinase